MARSKADLLQGTLDLLILKTLALGKLHGWGISKRIQQISGGILEAYLQKGAGRNSTI